MNTSKTTKTKEVLIADVLVSNEELMIRLNDGRRLAFPIDWYPRLRHGTPAERNNWILMGGGYAVHWPDLDEDLSVEGFLAGNPSFESAKAIQRWLKTRTRRKAG